VPVVWPRRDRRDRDSPQGPRGAGVPFAAASGGGDGLRRQRARRSSRGRSRDCCGRHKGHLFIKGKIVRVVPEDEMVEALVAEAEKLVTEGIDARLAAADAGAEREAEEDRMAFSRPEAATSTKRRSGSR